MVDLDDIRRTLIACRDVPWSCACITPQELEALVEEVERLRGERAAVVAYLKSLADAAGQADAFWQGVASGNGYAAQMIERGEHRREGDE